MLFTYDLIFVVTSFILASAGTGIAYLLLRRYGILDTPNARSNHSTPTLRGGGIGMVIAIALMLMVVRTPWQIALVFLLLAAVSFADDICSLPKRIRFAAQLVAVAIGLCNLSVDITPFPAFVEIPILALAWLWFINLFNFMDGSDGLATSEAVILALGVVLVLLPDLAPYPLLHIGLIVAAAALAFLPWNWHPAKIFMGDVGSIPLGFLLGYLLIALAGQGYLAAAVILPAAFVVDATSTLALRFKRGEKLTEAHSEHAYQRAIRAGMSHDAVAREFIAMNFLLVILALTSTFGFVASSASVILAYTAVLLFLVFRLRRFKEAV